MTRQLLMCALIAVVLGVGAGVLLGNPAQDQAVFAAQAQATLTPSPPLPELQPVAVRQVNAPSSGLPLTACGRRAPDIPSRFRLSFSSPYYPRQPFYSPDGSVVAQWLSDPERLSVRRADTGAMIVEISDHLDTVFEMVFSPDSNTFIIIRRGMKYRFSVYDLNTGEEWQLEGVGGGIQFSHDSTRIIFHKIGWVGSGCCKYFPPLIYDLTTRHYVSLALPDFPTVTGAFSSDDRWIALGMVWDFNVRNARGAATPGLYVFDTVADELVFWSEVNTSSVVFSPDGRYVVSLGGQLDDSPPNGRRIFVWDAHTGAASGTYLIEHVGAMWVDNTRVCLAYRDGEYAYVGEIALDFAP